MVLNFFPLQLLVYVIEGEWYKGDVMEVINEALASGDEPNASDGYTINGQPGDLYNCSRGTLITELIFVRCSAFVIER